MFQAALNTGRYGRVYYQGKLTSKSGVYPKGTEYAHTDAGFVYTIPQAPGIYCLKDEPPPIPDVPTYLVRAIDVSSHQPMDLTTLIQDTQSSHVVVKLYLPQEVISQDWSIAQGSSAAANNCSVGGYVWGYADLSPEQTILDALDLIPRVCPGTSMLWLDCEEYDGVGPLGSWIQRAVYAGEGLGQRIGVYSAKWYWDKIGNPEILSRISATGRPPLWIAQYNDIPDLDVQPLFGGWTREDIKGHQYTSTPIDQDVFLSDSL